MMGLFDGKIALVTGGSSGIGQATAVAFAREGANVAVTYNRNAKGGKETVRLIQDEGREAICVKTDVSKTEDIKAFVDIAVDTFGRLDYAFNNAAMGGRGASIVNTSEEDWDLVLDTNLKSVFTGMKYEISYMLRQGSGVIVNNSSVGGIIAGLGSLHYNASKHGVIGLSKAIALMYRKQNIRVNTVCPGFIQTPILDRAAKYIEYWKRLLVFAKKEQLIGEPDDIANVVVWLCSDAASFITGQTIVVDGGFTLESFVHECREYP